MKTSMTLAALIAFAAMLSAPSRAGAQEPAPAEKTGIKVGEKAPAFTLKGTDGEEHSLDELLSHGKVALVFYRSARW